MLFFSVSKHVQPSLSAFIHPPGRHCRELHVNMLSKYQNKRRGAACCSSEPSCHFYIFSHLIIFVYMCSSMSVCTHLHAVIQCVCAHISSCCVLVSMCTHMHGALLCVTYVHAVLQCVCAHMCMLCSSVCAHTSTCYALICGCAHL